jgi:uncharacterized protein YndB with AHSA1/START domain
VDTRTESNTASIRELTLTRVFDAPRALMFKLWTDPDHLARWWGPRMFTSVVRKWEARPGGKIDLTMTMDNGDGHPMGGGFREVDPPKRLVFTSTAFEDKDGNAELENLNTVTFEDDKGKTKVTVHVIVLKASAAVAGALAGMEMGWNQSLDKLAELIAQIR